MPKLAIFAVFTLALSVGCCVTGVAVNRVRRETLAWKYASEAARRKREEPPPRPLYAAPGEKAYMWVMLLSYGASGLALLVGGGAAAAAALRSPPAPKPGEGVVFRRNPTFECLLLVLAPLGVVVTLGGLAAKHPAALLPGLALLLLLGVVLLGLHAGTARTADGEGITLGFGRRFLWSDLVGCDYVREVQRTSTGGTRTVGGYHRLRFKNGAIKLRSHRYANWDACWQFVEPHLRRPAA